MTVHVDPAVHHALAEPPAGVPLHDHVGTAVHARRVPTHGALEHDLHVRLQGNRERMAAGRVQDVDLRRAVEHGLLDRAIDVPRRPALGVDGDAFACHLSHQRTSLAWSSCGTRPGSGKRARIEISSEARTTMSSLSAYSSGFVANWSRASPIPFAVEIR